MRLPDELILRNSVVRLEEGAAGIIARIERRTGVEYAGPIPRTTIDALVEVSTG